MSDWLPIETAPLGVSILAVFPPDALRREGRYGVCIVAAPFGDRITFDWPWGMEPTHWQPLPAPPEPQP